MKTQIIFESKNKNAGRKIICKEFEVEVKKSIFFILKEQSYLTQSQYEECLQKLEMKN